jgi:hypothetical protein
MIHNAYSNSGDSLFPKLFGLNVKFGLPQKEQSYKLFEDETERIHKQKENCLT